MVKNTCTRAMQCMCGQHQIWTSVKLSIFCGNLNSFIIPKYDIPLIPPFHLECSPSWHKLTIYTCRHLKNRNCTCILSNVLEGWIPLGSIFKQGTYVYLYHFNVKSSFALHDGFMVFATKMFQKFNALFRNM